MTDWRRTQSRANLSLAPNSLPTGKSAGNFASIWGLLGDNYYLTSALTKERAFPGYSEQGADQGINRERTSRPSAKRIVQDKWI